MNHNMTAGDVKERLELQAKLVDEIKSLLRGFDSDNYHRLKGKGFQEYNAREIVRGAMYSALIVIQEDLDWIYFPENNES